MDAMLILPDFRKSVMTRAFGPGIQVFPPPPIYTITNGWVEPCLDLKDHLLHFNNLVNAKLLQIVTSQTNSPWEVRRICHTKQESGFVLCLLLHFPEWVPVDASTAPDYPPTFNRSLQTGGVTRVSITYQVSLSDKLLVYTGCGGHPKRRGGGERYNAGI